MDGATSWWRPEKEKYIHIHTYVSNSAGLLITLTYLQIERTRLHKVIQVNEGGHHEASEYHYPAKELRGALIELHGKCDACEGSNGRMGCIICQGLEQWVLRQLYEIVTQQARYGYQGSQHNAHVDHGVTMWHRLHVAPCTYDLCVMCLVSCCCVDGTDVGFSDA